MCFVWNDDGPNGFASKLRLVASPPERFARVSLTDSRGLYKRSFADLGGEAVRKIRVDFGIPIEFGKIGIYSRSQIEAMKKPGHTCAIGCIRYSAVDGPTAPDGIIVYIKPACYGNEPRDIYEYFKRSETFPHESTADQFFSESQFESYRMLGAYTMDQLCTECRGDFRSFIRHILERHLEMKPSEWPAELIEPSADTPGQIPGNERKQSQK